MGRYSSRVANRQGPDTQRAPHAVWNTIGCLMIVVVTIMSIAAAYQTVQYGVKHGWPIPPAMLQTIILPDWIYSLPGLAALLLKVVGVNYLLAYIAAAILYMVVLGGVISFLYAVLYRFAGPPKYGPLDAPPVKGRSERYRR